MSKIEKNKKIIKTIDKFEKAVTRNIKHAIHNTYSDFEKINFKVKDEGFGEELMECFDSLAGDMQLHVDEGLLGAITALRKIKKKFEEKKEKKFYDVALCLPCSDLNVEDEIDPITITLNVRFRDQEQQEILDDVGTYSDCLGEFNKALSEGKGRYEGKEKDIKNKIKRAWFVDDAGIEIEEELAPGSEIDVDLSNKE